MLKIILTILLSLPTPKGVSKAEHAAWIERVAPTIAQAAQGDRQVAAYLVALGTYESHFAKPVQAGHCKGYGGCDGGLAHTMWQMHREALHGVTPADVVGTDDQHLQAAAEAAAHHIRQARKMCGASHPAWVFGGYMRSCRDVPPKLAQRLRLYRLVLRKLK